MRWTSLLPILVLLGCSAAKAREPGETTEAVEPRDGGGLQQVADPMKNAPREATSVTHDASTYDAEEPWYGPDPAENPPPKHMR